MKCIVVIPIYKEKLNSDEEQCVKQYQKVLLSEEPEHYEANKKNVNNADECETKMVFICPEHLNTKYYEETFSGISYERFADKFFTGTKSYNHLMLDVSFYQRFIQYDYMLIAQTDAVIWSEENKLYYFMDLGFDYIGAPWIPERNIWEWRWNKKKDAKRAYFQCCKKSGQGISMGNGGFCLRKISSCIALIKEFQWRKCYWFLKRNEDIFFGVFGEYNKCGFKLADINHGLEFAREYHLRESVQKGEIPFGVHGWQKEFSSYEEMKQFMEEHGVQI